MPIIDRSIAWKTVRQFITINEFAGMSPIDGVGWGTGAPTIQEVSTFGVGGMQAGAAGDMLATVFPIPWNLNRDKKVRGRVFFSHSQAAADTPDFIVGTKFFAKTVALTTAESPEASGAITHTNTATAFALEVTNWIDLNWNDYITNDDVLALINLEINGLGSAGGDEITIIGLELEWENQSTDSNRRHRIQGEPVDSV